MTGPRKISLEDAATAGADALLLQCQNRFAHCTHAGSLSIAAAADRWGAGVRLDQIPARCTACGSAAFVEVRPSYPHPKPSGELDALIRRSWRER